MTGVYHPIVGVSRRITTIRSLVTPSFLRRIKDEDKQDTVSSYQEYIAGRGDRIWLLGCVLLFLAPSLILVTVELFAVASAWFALWLVYLVFAIRIFPRVQTTRKF